MLIKRIIAITLLCVSSQSVSAQMHFWLSTASDSSIPGETPNFEVAHGSTRDIYIWAKPEAGKTLENFSLNLVSSSETAIEFLSAEIVNGGRFGSVFDTTNDLNIAEQSTCVFPAPLHGIWGITALSVDPETGTGLNPSFAGEDLNFDDTNGSWLVAEVSISAAAIGTTELSLEIGNIGMNYEGEQAEDLSVLFGGLDDSPLSNAFEDRCTTSDAVDAELSVVDSIVGDFNANGLLDAEDMDLLSIEVFAETNDAFYELTGDATVNEDDRVHWVESLKGTNFGDPNLDGVADFTDFLIVSTNFGLNTGWANGDMDGDRLIDFPDFLRLSTNFGKGTLFESEAVPEPNPCVPALLITGLFMRRRRRSGQRAKHSI